MTGKDDRLYLRHILDAIQQVQQYLAGVDWDDFSSTRLVQDGVIRQIEIICEAAKHLSMQTRLKAPHVLWKEIAGMRDKLIHQYFGVDLQAVWLTANDDLPALEKAVTKLIVEWGE